MRCRQQLLAAIVLLLLLVPNGRVDALKDKRRHVKAVAKHLAKQLAKAQLQTSKKSAKVTSTMSYSAAVGFCRARIPMAHGKLQSGSCSALGCRLVHWQQQQHSKCKRVSHASCILHMHSYTQEHISIVSDTSREGQPLAP